jgi:hypothetical protein
MEMFEPSFNKVGMNGNECLEINLRAQTFPFIPTLLNVFMTPGVL